MRIEITKVRKLLESKLMKLEITPKEARVIADEYLQGEIKGKHFSH